MQGKHPRRPTKSRAEEKAFLAAYDPGDFPRPSVAVDVALVTVRDGALEVLVLRRGEHPDLGAWALPGGFVQLDESLDDAARRVLGDKAGLEDIFLEQLYTFGAPSRDPRMRVISVAYYALVDPRRLDRALEAREGTRIARLEVPWEGETGGSANVIDHDAGPLRVAFDHSDILGLVVQRLRGKLDYAALGFQLLPHLFTLRDLQLVHEAVLGTELNKDSFRRRLLASGLLEATGEREKDVPYRPAELYRIPTQSAT